MLKPIYVAVTDKTNEEEIIEAIELFPCSSEEEARQDLEKIKRLLRIINKDKLAVIKISFEEVGE